MTESIPNHWPPLNPQEFGSQSASRLEEEREAKRINDEIERRIERDRHEMKKKRPQAKLLLLGPAEAGKSTLLKNFQLQFAPKAFQAETDAWRAVIHLNLVRGVNFILEMLSRPLPSATSSIASRSASSLSHNSNRNPPSDPYRSIRLRLSPLRQAEDILQKRICGDTVPNSPTLSVFSDSSESGSSAVRAPTMSVRARSGWKALARIGRPMSSTQDEIEAARNLIEQSRENIVELWKDDIVRLGLRERRVLLEDYYVYFLDHAARIAAPRYQPTPEDILRARVQTIGVEEHRLVLETVDPGQEWIFYDVEGCRGQRPAWAPYFDDVNAMIFLCPLASFDVYLPDDPPVNSLDETYHLWKQMCKSRLLKEATFILFLNKMDLLKAKLDAGVQFSNHVSVYKNQPNDAENIASYLKKKFTAVHRKERDSRSLHVHMTCAIDTRTMSTILKRVKDVILISALKDTAMI